jgi:hypothetical protein
MNERFQEGNTGTSEGKQGHFREGSGNLREGTGGFTAGKQLNRIISRRGRNSSGRALQGVSAGKQGKYEKGDFRG